MHIKSKSAVLQDAVRDWQERALLDAPTAKALRDDISSEAGAWGFQGFIIAAGVACLAFASMSFVAANWDEIPRLGRVILIFAVMWSTWAGALWCARAKLEIWFECLSALACGFFGAGIMLISQIYHIQGEPADAVWLWGVGTLIAAALARSFLTLALAIALFFTWNLMGLDIFHNGLPNFSFLIWWALGAVLAWLLQSRLCAHLSVFSLAVWLLMSVMENMEHTTWVLAVVGGLFAVTSLLLTSLGNGQFLRGFEPAALGYTLALTATFSITYFFASHMDFDPFPAQHFFAVLLPILICAGLAIWGQAKAFSHRYDLWVTLVAQLFFVGILLYPQEELLFAAFSIGLAVWVTRMGWRLETRILRFVGISAFIIAMISIYLKTVGSLLGTAGFYLGAGVLLIGAAIWASRRAKKTDEPAKEAAQ